MKRYETKGNVSGQVLVSVMADSEAEAMAKLMRGEWDKEDCLTYTVTVKAPEKLREVG